MNKTVTANISGVVFHIETDAYEKLHQYLNTIKTYFKDSDGTEEIMADIEARIAELFKEKLATSSDVITMVHVNQVVEIMGEPEQYMDEDAEEYTHTYESRSNSSSNWKTKKLYRDEEDGNIGGVCSGLGYYFGIDRIWIRAAFIIAVIGFGTGFLLYLILWIIMPAAKTTSEKLEMKGEPINVQNIGNSIKDEFNHFKKKVDHKGGTQFVRKTENSLYRFFDFLGKIIVFALKFLVKFIGILFILIALAGIITFLVFLIGGPFDLTVNNFDLANYWTTDIAEIFFSSKSMFYTGLVGLALVTFIPLLGLLYGGAKILFDIRNSNRAINISAISLLIIGVILICVAATTTAAEYSNSQSTNENITLHQLSADTIYLGSLENTYNSERRGIDQLYVENNEIMNEDLRLNIVKNRMDEIELKLYKTAKGRSRKDAGRRAENIRVKYLAENNELRLSPLTIVPFKDGFRDQRVKASLALPVGTTVYIEPSAIDVIYNVKNVEGMWDRKMVGHFWLMTTSGLSCTDCEKKEKVENLEEKSIVGKIEIDKNDIKVEVGDGHGDNVSLKINAK